LISIPCMLMARTAVKSERGIARAVMMVAELLIKKRSTVRMTRRAPSRSAEPTLSTATSMKSACRKTLS
jgi:hypothetical protein